MDRLNADLSAAATPTKASPRPPYPLSADWNFKGGLSLFSHHSVETYVKPSSHVEADDNRLEIRRPYLNFAQTTSLVSTTRNKYFMPTYNEIMVEVRKHDQKFTLIFLIECKKLSWEGQGDVDLPPEVT
jgi:hypothetical protein